MIPKLRYENDIGSLTFNDGIPGAYIESVTSYGGQNVEFQTTKSNREIGETLQHQNVGPKTMTVKGTIAGESDALKAQMIHVLAPLAKGLLIYSDGEKELELEVYVKVSPDVGRISNGAKFSFSLYAPYPYWRKHERESQTLTGLKPKFKFPWNISDPNPFKMSEYAAIGYVTVVNTGEAPAYWTVDFLALDEVTNPRIYNMATGEQVKILKTLAEGEMVSVSTEGDELTVTVTGADGSVSDGFRYLDITSIPFKLAVGENYIKTDAESNTIAMRTSIGFRPAYVGV